MQIQRVRDSLNMESQVMQQGDDLSLASHQTVFIVAYCVLGS